MVSAACGRADWTWTILAVMASRPTVDAPVARVLTVGREPPPLGAAPWSSLWVRVRSQDWVAGGGVDGPAHGPKIVVAEQTGWSAHKACGLGRTWRQALRSGAPAGWLWALGHDPFFKEALHEAEVVWSRDEDTDRALDELRDLTNGIPVVRSDGRTGRGDGSVWEATEAWQTLLVRLERLVDPPVDRQRLMRGVREAQSVVSTVAAARVPLILAPVDRTLELVQDALYWASGQVADRLAYDVGAALLGPGPSWVSGSLPAVDCAIRLRTQWPDVREEELQGAVVAAVRAAEAARASGRRDAARAHLLAALNVMFHRARHSQRAPSTLVCNTKVVLEPLGDSRTWDGLRDDSRPRPGAAYRSRGGREQLPKISVLPGPFGAFHTHLTEALAPVSQISVSRLRAARFELRRRRPIPIDLWLLEAVREGRVNLGDGTIDGAPISDPAIARYVRTLFLLKVELSGHDVVISDWGDVATFWASHLCPVGTRLITRLHGLDLFDPWLHLVDWRGIDLVLTSHQGLGGLFADLTAAAGAPAAQIVQPYLPCLHDYARPKSSDAYRTLGMVGWGRLVKDPAFALDLLDRDARRRLVLIGPGFADSPDPNVNAYAAALQARIDSPQLKERVRVVGPTDDVAAELQEVGIILSCSLREGWHLGLIEGAASGAVPVVRDWPMLAEHRATSLYPSEWVVPDLDTADATIRALGEPDVWASRGRRCQDQALQLFEPEAAAARYRELILPG